MAKQKQKLSTGDLSKLWGIGPDKIRRWILSGELPAINIAFSRDRRPRYLIDLADIRAFESKRAVTPVVSISRRRRTTGPGKSYF